MFLRASLILALAALSATLPACSCNSSSSPEDGGPLPDGGGIQEAGSDTGSLADGNTGDTGLASDGAGSGDGGAPDSGPVLPGWAWVNGSDAISSTGSYGTLGTAAISNEPPAREAAASATGPGGKLWLFGGYSYVGNSALSYLNDLWSYDTTSGEWTWVAGSSTPGTASAYPAAVGGGGAAYYPGERAYATLWVDASGTVWLFGGCNTGMDCTNAMNDFWKLSGTSWTWVAGSSTVDAPSSYPATVGMGGATYTPGARSGAASWIDSTGYLWLFGGLTSANDYLNDLWKFDGSVWTWAAGSSSTDVPGKYGVKGMATGTNYPGGRQLPTYGLDAKGDVWLMGGYGFDSTGASGYMNDLWKFDGTNWTWLSGSDTGSGTSMAAVTGVYPPKPGETLPLDAGGAAWMPGGRESACSWIDSAGIFWMFGGWGYDDSATMESYLNDLWKFDGTSWTWVSGSDLVNAVGVYGMLDMAAPTNTPGARWNPNGWYAANKLWMFGGSGYDTMATAGVMNDLWTYQP